MESFYVTSTHLDIEMETEPHPSGLVIFSRKLSPDGKPIGHINSVPWQSSHGYILRLPQEKPTIIIRA